MIYDSTQRACKPARAHEGRGAWCSAANAAVVCKPARRLPCGTWCTHKRQRWRRQGKTCRWQSSNCKRCYKFLTPKKISLNARAQLPPQFPTMDGKVKPVESATNDYETQAADRGSDELSAHAGGPCCAVWQEQTEEAHDVAAPAAGEDGGGSAQGRGIKNVHLQAVVRGGHGGGLGPRARTKSAGTPAKSKCSARGNGVEVGVGHM
jgi:hypothetical protein